MSFGAIELQRAVFAALSADVALTALLGGAKVFDVPPDRPGFPYVCFGKLVTNDWSTSTERGAEHFLALHCWSRGKGRKEAMAIAEAIAMRLHDADLPLTGHHLVSLRVTGSEFTYDDRFTATRGVVRLHALTETVS